LRGASEVDIGAINTDIHGSLSIEIGIAVNAEVTATVEFSRTTGAACDSFSSELEGFTVHSDFVWCLHYGAGTCITLADGRDVITVEYYGVSDTAILIV
jgi:hypothetical protein